MPVNGLSAYRKPLLGEEKKRFDENWDTIFGKKENNICDTKAIENQAKIQT
jgi:hypothetical protein